MILTDKQLNKIAEQIFRSRVADKTLYFNSDGGFITAAQYEKLGENKQGYTAKQNPFFIEEKKAKTKTLTTHEPQ